MEIRIIQLEPYPRQLKDIGQNDDIYLSIKIGNGQQGGNYVTSNGKILAKGDLTDRTYLGNVNELQDTDIETETNVLDANNYTNLCVITTTFYNQDNKILFTKIDKGDAPEKGIASFNGKYALKLLGILILFCTISFNNLFAQSDPDNISFQSLETPTSPGFILLDQTPASIEKPTTSQGLGLSLLGFQRNGGAIEFTPFWLKDHPNLTSKEMSINKFPILYSFSISVATVKTDTANYFASGIRTRLYQNYNKSQRAKLDSLEKEIVNELSQPVSLINKDKIEKLRQAYIDLTEKPTFTVDFAAALGGSSVTNSFNDAVANRWAAWLAFNWRPKGDDFYFTVLSRYINNEKFENYITQADLVDLGTRLNYDISKFCLSLEYLQRLNMTHKKYDDFRVAIIGSYKISENLYLTSTFGKNFTNVNNIIALAGVNFGFSKNKIKAY